MLTDKSSDVELEHSLMTRPTLLRTTNDESAMKFGELLSSMLRVKQKRPSDIERNTLLTHDCVMRLLTGSLPSNMITDSIVEQLAFALRENVVLFYLVLCRKPPAWASIEERRYSPLTVMIGWVRNAELSSTQGALLLDWVANGLSEGRHIGNILVELAEKILDDEHDQVAFRANDFKNDASQAEYVVIDDLAEPYLLMLRWIYDEPNTGILAREIRKYQLEKQHHKPGDLLLMLSLNTITTIARKQTPSDSQLESVPTIKFLKAKTRAKLRRLRVMPLVICLTISISMNEAGSLFIEWWCNSVYAFSESQMFLPSTDSMWPSTLRQSHTSSHFT